MVDPKILEIISKVEDPEVREAFYTLLSYVEEKQSMNFEMMQRFQREIAETQRTIEKNIAELTEAHRRSEERIAKLEQATIKLEQSVTELKESVAELKETVAKLEQAVAELTEAHRKAEERISKLEQAIAELTEAHRKAEERIAKLEQTTAKLEQTIAELTEAQKKTEKRLEELSEAQRKTEEKVAELTEAQKKTEKKLAELAEAQQRTERELAKLAAEHRKTREQLGGLSHTVGYILEDRSYIALPRMLKEEMGVEVVGRLSREFVEVSPGRFEEVNIIGEGRLNGRRLWILGECKTQLKKRDITSFLKKVERLEKVLKGDKLLVMVTYQAHPKVRKFAEETGVRLYFSHDLLHNIFLSII